MRSLMDEMAQLIEDVTTPLFPRQSEGGLGILADWCLDHPDATADLLAGLLRQAPGILGELLKERLAIAISRHVNGGDGKSWTTIRVGLYFDGIELSTAQIDLR
jgi:hypothetical protein